MALAGIEVRSQFVFVGGCNEFAVFFFHFAKEVVQLGGVLLLQETLKKLASISEASSDNVGERQIVAVVVRVGLDALGLLQIRSGRGDLSASDVQLAKVVIGVVIPGLELKRFLELLFGKGKFFPAREVSGQIRSGRSRVRLQAHSLFQVRGGLGILRLRGIDQSQQFVNLEAFRNLA